MSRYQEAAKQVEEGKLYNASEAFDLVKKIDFANFDAEKFAIGLFQGLI